MDKDKAIEKVRAKAKGFDVLKRCYRVVNFWLVVVEKYTLPFVYRVYDNGEVVKIR